MSETTNGTTLGDVIFQILVVVGLIIMLVVVTIASRSDRRALCPLAYTTYESSEDFFREHSMCRYMLDEEGS